MMIDLRKVLVIFVIAILFAVFVFATIDAFYPPPEYEKFCPPGKTPIPVYDEKGNMNVTPEQCEAAGGRYYPDGRYCDYYYTCNQELQNAQKQYNFVVFIISAILGLIAIALGMYLPTHENTIYEWIGTGFMLGGLFALFFGTVRSYNDLQRVIKPIVIFVELVLVIFIAYKKLGDRVIVQKTAKAKKKR